MALSLPVLDSIAIASPCAVPWDEMHGDNRTRFCTKCSQAVHDISEMSTEEALQLVTRDEQSVCIRIHRRTDGRVMTSDCPANRRERLWRWLGRRSALAASVFALLFLAGCGGTTPIQGGTCAKPIQKGTSER
jgi:hypothetical protein